MKTNYTIKNFRVFDKNGVTVEIAPMTFLVGCNSSGKSSIVKSLTLLRTFFGNRFDKEHPVVGSTIDFSTKPNNTLGSFGNVVRSSSRVKEVSFAYDTRSAYLNDDVTVELTMEAGELGNARVKAVKFSKKDGPVIVSAKSGGSTSSVAYNLAPVMESFIKFLVADRYRTDLKSLLPKFPEEELSSANEERINELDREALRFCSSDYLLEIYRNSEIKIEKDKYVTAAVDKLLETGIMTYYTLFDEMGDMSSPEDVSRFLKSKVRDNELHDTLFNVIDYVAGLYAASGCPDFLTYISSLDAKRLRVKDGMGPKFFDRLNIRGLVEDGTSFYEAFRFNRMDIIYSIFEGPVRMENIDPYELVNGMLSNLVNEEEPYSSVVKSMEDPTLRTRVHHLWNALAEYVEKFCMEVVSKDITEGLDYVSSSRIQVRRMYPMEDRNDFSDAVRRYFDTKSKFMTLNPPITVNYEDEDGTPHYDVKVADFMPGSFMNKWLRAFKIGDRISLEMDKNGLGLLLKVYISESDKKGRLLADMGYGITQLFSILLQIEEMIMSAYYECFKDKVTTAHDQKRGLIRRVSIGSPDMLFRSRTLAIEEPEIHLHPKYQSLLAEMFYEAYKEFNIQFIIETHSEYLLRKIQTLVGAGKLSPEEVSLVYVEDDEEVIKGKDKVHRIQVKKDGRLESPFGSGFYDEADNLSMELFANMKR